MSDEMSDMVDQVARRIWAHMSECLIKSGDSPLPTWDDKSSARIMGKETDFESSQRVLAVDLAKAMIEDAQKYTVGNDRRVAVWALKEALDGR